MAGCGTLSGGGSRARVAGCGTPTRWRFAREGGRVWHTDAAVVVPTRAWPGVAHGHDGWPGRADARHPATGPPRRFLPRVAGCDASRGGWGGSRAGSPRAECDGGRVAERAKVCKAHHPTVAGCGTPTRRWWWCRRERGQVWHTDTKAGRGEQTRGTQLRDLRAASSHVWPGATRAGVVGEARARGRLGRSAMEDGWVRGLRCARRANAQWPGVAH